MPDAPKLPPRPVAAIAAPRASTAARGYGHAHRKQRARLLRQQPLCQRCEDAWAVHLHHKDRNPFNRAASNVEMLCERCHQAEHDGR
jgi:5-methylcytosine-specific restriction endonuclease McrA